MGFATGFNTGWGAVSDTVKEYERLKQKREFEAAQKEKEFQKYTPQQGEFLRGLGAETVDVGGEAKPRYQFDIDPGSTNYRVKEIMYPDAPTRTEGMSFGGPMYEEAAAPARRSREEIARMYTVGTPYDGPVDLKGEPIYPPDVAMGGDNGRGLTARDTGISRPANTVSPRPEDSGLYSQLLNRYGETVTMTPGATEYLGKTYEGGLSASQRDAALMNRYADIIATTNPMEAMKLRTMAKQEERAQAGESRAAKEFDLRTKISDYQLKAYERGEKQDTAEDKLLEDIKADPSIMRGDWATVAAKYGIRPERFNKITEGVLGLEKGKIQQMTMAVEKAYRNSKGNLNTFLQSTLDDDDYDPTSHMVARKGPNGGVIIDVVETVVGGKNGKIKQAGKVISSLPEQANELEALDTAYAVLASPGQAAQTALKNQKAREELAYMRKHGNYFESMGEAYKSGARGGRADTTERDISGRVTALNSILTQNRETIKDIDTQLKDLGSRKDEASLKQKDALIKQRNDLNQDSEEIRKELSGIRRPSKFSGDGGGLSRDGYQAGDVVSYIDPSGKTVQARFKGGENKQANWEPITAGSTTDTPASKGLEKPSGKGMSEKDYENWIDDKLIGTFTSRLQELQLIAKDNPNPQIRAAAQRLLEKEKTRPQAGGVDAPL